MKSNMKLLNHSLVKLRRPLYTDCAGRLGTNLPCDTEYTKLRGLTHGGSSPCSTGEGHRSLSVFFGFLLQKRRTQHLEFVFAAFFFADSTFSASIEILETSSARAMFGLLELQPMGSWTSPAWWWCVQFANLCLVKDWKGRLTKEED